MAKCIQKNHKYCGHIVHTINKQGNSQILRDTLKRARARCSQVQYNDKRKETKIYQEDGHKLKTQYVIFSAVVDKFNIKKFWTRDMVNNAVEISKNNTITTFYDSIERDGMRIAGTLNLFYQSVKTGIIGK